MRRMWSKILICLGLLLGIIILGIQLYLLPFLQQKLDQRLQAWLGQESIALHYEDLRLIWFGIRIEKVQIESRSLQAMGAIEVQLNLWPDLNFGQAQHLILDSWTCRWRRASPTQASTSPTPSRAPMASLRSLSRLQPLLQKIMQRGMTLELRRSTIRMLDAQEQDILEVPTVQLTYAAVDQALQFSAEKLLYRRKEILRGIEGQILLQKISPRFPFLMTARDTGDVPWQVQGALSKDFDSFELRHKRQGLPATWKPYVRMIAPQENLQLLLKLSVHGLRQSEFIGFDIQIASNNLHLKHNLLGEIPWGPFPFSLRSKGELHPETGALKLQTGLVHLVAHQDRAPIRVFFSAQKADLLAPLSQQPLRVDLSMPDTPCQILLDALPEHAFPLLNGFSLRGSMRTAAQVQLLKKDESVIKLGEQAFGCSLQSIPERFSRSRLMQRQDSGLEQNGSESAEAKVFATLTGPDFVPLSQIAEGFLKGIVSAEDGSFWQHEGFRWGALQAALQANLKAGRVVYGGSTLTMQLVKNLYLSHERVLSRKVQELYLAWALEQVLSKEEILEIYANIVEFGPQMRGISKASRGYFGKSPRDLTLAESVYLASILPSPHRFFAEHYCSGRLNEPIIKRMQKTANGIAALIGSRWIRDFQEDLRTLHFYPSQQQRFCRGEMNIGLSGRPKAKTF